MTFSLRWTLLPVAVAVTLGLLAGCGPEVDDTTGSRLAPTPYANGQMPQPVEAGDIAIAGQYFAHAINDLPAVSGAANPPLVQFTGVTSIVVGKEPVDTEPYTDLLRDRLLLGTREHLRFVERTLPLLVPPPKKIHSRKDLPPDQYVSTDPDYQVIAELRGREDDPSYRVAIQFVDFHSGQVLYDALYNIRKEAVTPDQTTTTTDTQIVPASAMPPPAGMGGTVPAAPSGAPTPVDSSGQQAPPGAQ
jgi:hypothetical protein